MVDRDDLSAKCEFWERKRKMTTSLSKVTVCIPVRNGAWTIERTLDSILAQDYPNFEMYS